MKLLPQLRAWIHARTAPPDIQTAAGQDLDRLAGLKERPAGMTDATLRRFAIADVPSPCIVCGTLADPPFWTEHPVPMMPYGEHKYRAVPTRAGPYCFPHWPGRAY